MQDRDAVWGLSRNNNSHTDPVANCVKDGPVEVSDLLANSFEREKQKV